MSSPCPRGLRAEISLHRLFLLLTLAAVFLVGGLPAQAQVVCDRSSCGTVRQGNAVVCFTPAKPVSSTLWGDLQPVDGAQLPSERDATNFNEFRESYDARNWYYGVDIENGWVLAGLAHGIGVWDARSNPANPTFLVARRYTPGRAFPYLPAGEQAKIVFGAIDAPEGVDTVAALAGYNGAGMLVIDLSNKAEPRPAYQNTDKTSESVYAAKIGGTNYAFMASSLPSGLYVYNLDKAVAQNGCFEDAMTPAAGQCGGVLTANVSTIGTPYFVHGTGNYIVVSFGSSKGFQIFDVSNPASPQLKLTGLRTTSVQGVALWKQGSTYYLGARQGNQTAVYDVSCITGTCSGLGSPLDSKTTDTGSTTQYLTFSRSNSKPFLYVGGDNYCLGHDGAQHEWLFDASNPSQLDDVTPAGTTTVSGLYNGSTVNKTINYWSWYYRGSPTGYNLVAPRSGKFHGDYFFRAARAIFDIHKLTSNNPPVANFTWSPAEIYPGTPVTFSDASTGAPTIWNWSFADGTPASSTAQSPQVTFGSEGVKTVSLTSRNSAGDSNPLNKAITVLNPAPQIGSVTVSPASPLVCQPVTLAATGVTGQPTLGYAWDVKKDGVGIPVVTGANGSLIWNTIGILPGNYTATLTVSNGVGNAAKSASFTLNPLSPLPTSFAPTNEAFTSGTVKFHVVAAGATEWNWDFGSGYTGWTSDPVNGPNPTFTYTTTGEKTVRVMVKNCVEAQRESSPLTVNITQTTPLEAGFQADVFCTGFGCIGTTNQAVAFVDQSTGAQFWDYDWNGDGTYEEADKTSPVTTHTYTAAGSYAPKLRVKRGNEEDVFTHRVIIISNASGGGGGGGGNTASISISGPTTGQVSTAYTYTATASNCTASSTGWTWNVGGGSATGATNANSISISWATPGNKTVSATNSGCSGAQDTHSVNISNGGGGGGGNQTLAAVFTVSPAAPKPGELATFNGTSSTGSPENYEWRFGDGAKAFTATATHTYAAAGNYEVILTVTKPGGSCLLGMCIAESRKTLVVVGTPPPPPPSAEFAASVSCTTQFGFDSCAAQTGQTVTLTATLADATSYAWDFGDGTTGTGRTVTHSWSAQNSYPVILTVVKDALSSTKTRVFNVSGVTAPPAGPKAAVLPWIAQTRGALVQSSDLYVHNPSTSEMKVSLYFRKRGKPESNPPKVTQTIAPGATLFAGDVLRELFDRQDQAGFITLVVDEGDVEPVITSFNTTFQPNGTQFGQTVSGIAMSRLGTAASSQTTPQIQHLIGLNDNSDRRAYFGVSNPNDEPATFHLKFYDNLGRQIGQQTEDFTVARFGQRQFQAEEIRGSFGVNDVDDYRIEVVTTQGNRVVPYGSNLRQASDDPSFVVAGSSKNSKVYLLGVLTAPGLNNSIWQTDILLANTSGQSTTSAIRFTALGNAASPTAPAQVTLQPGTTERLINALETELGVENGVGVLTIQSESSDSVFPIVQGESYDNAIPSKRFGQSMSALTDADAAGTGKGQYLVGLRQDAKYRTTLWLFNPSDGTAEYDVIYRGLDGQPLGTLTGVRIGPGKVRQFSPSQHPLAPAGVANGFTIQIVVKSGKVLSAAQVINNATNDPAYIQGEVR